MIYRAIGMVVWHGTWNYLRLRYGRQLKAGAGAAAFLGVLGLGYLFTRPNGE